MEMGEPSNITIASAKSLPMASPALKSDPAETAAKVSFADDVSDPHIRHLAQQLEAQFRN
jgi:hypothetical protein